MQTSTATPIQFPAKNKVLVLGFDADTPLRAQYMGRAEFWDPSQIMKPDDIPNGIGLISIHSHCESSEIARVRAVAQRRGIATVSDSSLVQLRETLKKHASANATADNDDRPSPSSPRPTEPTRSKPTSTLGDFVRANYNRKAPVISQEAIRLAGLFHQQTGRTASSANAVAQQIYAIRKKEGPVERREIPRRPQEPDSASIDTLFGTFKSMLEHHRGMELAVVSELVMRCKESEAVSKSLRHQIQILETENASLKKAQDTLKSIDGLLRRQ